MVEVTESFELNNEVIDNDHRQLSKMVNEIVRDLDCNDATACREKVVEFAAFLKQHFQREETLLEQQGYPDLDHHREHHAALNKKMDHILGFADMSGVNEKACESLKKELVYFLMDDVISTDLSFKDFVSEE